LYVYVACYNTGLSDGRIRIIDTQTNTILPTAISGFSGPFAIAMSQKKMYVSNFGSNNFTPYGTTVSVVDLLSNTITNTITVGIQASGLAITPDGKYLYVSNYNTLYNQAYTYMTTPPVTIQNLVPGAGTINIIDLETYEVIAPIIAVDQSPANLAITPNGKWLLCSNYTSNTVNGIKINGL
jgi:DNA-binding beta-propeller fold protein YncE